MMKSFVKQITVILADDHILLRDGLKSSFKKIREVSLVAEASNGQELFDIVKKFQPDVVITDIKMPVMDGIEVTKLIKKEYPLIKVIALSNYDEENMVYDMVIAGADGYLLKNVDRQELLQCIRKVHAGDPYFCTASSRKILESMRGISRNPEIKIVFAPKEIELMRLIAKGLSNKQIAAELRVKGRTIESRRAALQEKIGVKGAVAVALYAKEHGLL
jgi:DNA-binding NarL/FixJ family response regulator